MFSKILCCSLFIASCVFLASCSLEGVSTSPPKHDVTVSEYKDHLGTSEIEIPPNMSTYGIFVSQSPTNDMSEKTITMEDISSPLYITCNHKGPASLLTLTIYYDYQQIPFCVGAVDESLESYTFYLEDNQEIQIPVVLDTITADENRHILLFSIVSDSDKHSAKQEDISNSTVFTHICNLRYPSSKPSTLSFLSSQTIPKCRYHCPEAVALILNTDYDNQGIQKNNLPALPPPVYEVPKGAPFELMYNITGTQKNSHSSLLFVTVNCQQEKINDKDFLISDIQQGETLNGVLHLMSPTIPGLYEIIGYVIFNPFDSPEKTFMLSETSLRFTLHVI